MPEPRSAEAFLADCAVDPAVLALRPDYRALLLVADGLEPDSARAGRTADRLIAAAEDRARALLEAALVEELPHIAAWRDAYRAFGPSPSAPATASRRSRAARRRGSPG